MEPRKVSFPTAKPTESAAVVARVSAHSHIKGLGLKPDGTADEQSDGLVGQQQAREAAGVVVDLVKEKLLAGRGILLAGPPGTGKTAVGMGIAQELGKEVPFVVVSGSEVFSLEVKKSEVLIENFRRAIGVRLREVKEVFEGEVVVMEAEETENPHGGQGKAISSINLTLKSTKGTKSLKLAPQIHEGINREKVRVGDVVFIEPLTGSIKRIGRSDALKSEFDLESEEYIPLPKGDVRKKKEVVQELSLHDIDVSNAKPQGGTDLLSVVNQYVNNKRTEITEKLRSEVDDLVNEFISKGTAEMTPGVLFIDEAHMLDVDCFAFLNRALESDMAPVVVFATNRGVSTVRGTEMISPHGIPADLLDRLLIIQTFPYTLVEVMRIVGVRAKLEKVQLSEGGLQALGEAGQAASLRFALQLLTPSRILMETKGHEAVEAADVEEARLLFYDAKQSARRLQQAGASFIC